MGDDFICEITGVSSNYLKKVKAAYKGWEKRKNEGQTSFINDAYRSGYKI